MFVLTYGRSGSTLLAQILNSIPGYRIKGENNNALYGLFTAFEALALAKRKYGGKVRLLSWDGAEDIRVMQFTKQCIAAFVTEVLQPRPGDQVIGFKEIRYFHHQDKLDDYVRFIMRFFPQSKIVINIRNPKDVAKSGWWVRRRNAPTRIAHYNHVLTALAATDPSRFHLVDYDQYAKNAGALESLFKWLDEPFSEQQVAAVLAARKYS